MDQNPPGKAAVLSVAEIQTAVGSSKDLTLQVYAAARLIAATPPEKAFLGNLAKAPARDSGLFAHLDATAASLAPPT